MSNPYDYNQQNPGVHCPLCHKIVDANRITFHIWDDCEPVHNGAAIIKTLHEGAAYLILCDYDGNNFAGVYLMLVNSIGTVTRLTNDPDELGKAYTAMSERITRMENKVAEDKAILRSMNMSPVSNR